MNSLVFDSMVDSTNRYTGHCLLYLDYKGGDKLTKPLRSVSHKTELYTDRGGWVATITVVMGEEAVKLLVST